MDTEQMHEMGERLGRRLADWGLRISERISAWQRRDPRNRTILITLLMGFGVLYLLIIFLTF